jgi:ribonuclease HII
MLTIGIDDAGRGPVIGPMILAGCILDKKTAKELKILGVKDSKQITPKRREFLAEKIREKAKAIYLTKTYPLEIESASKKGINLNDIEANKTAEIINSLNNKKDNFKVFVDCPSVSITKWQKQVNNKIGYPGNLVLSCEHRADKTYTSVSAASILAKSLRESEIEKLKKKYGNKIGSGYPSDPLTKIFLEENAQKYAKDGIFRRTWSSWIRADQNLGQRKL